MAIIRFKDGRDESVTREMSHRIWFILNGEANANEAQERYCEQIDKIYLNRHYAPQSYLDAYDHILGLMN